MASRTSRQIVHIFSKYNGLASMIAQRLESVDVVNLKITDTDTRSQLSQAEVLVADPGLLCEHGLVQELPKLKWLMTTWAGLDAVYRTIDKSKPLPAYTITRFSSYFGQSMGEYSIGWIIAHERKFNAMKKGQAAKQWLTDEVCNYRTLPQLQLGILGVGAIGSKIAEMCKCLGMEIWGLGRSNKSCEYIDHYRTVDGISDIFAKCDYIVSVLPDTAETRNLLTEDILKHGLQKKPVLINIGRGTISHEDTLISALNKGFLSHVILDVFEDEPLPTESPLWDHPEVSITPHCSGVSFAHEIAEDFVKQYERYSSGQPLQRIFNWELGY